MCQTKRKVDCSAEDFLAAWWRGDAGPIPCVGCMACCYYDGIPVDAKRDRRTGADPAAFARRPAGLERPCPNR